MSKPLKVAYCTLNDVIQRINADSSSVNVNTTSGQTAQINTESLNTRAELTHAIYVASALMSQKTGYVFVPYEGTVTYPVGALNDINVYIWDDMLQVYVLTLPDALLSLSSVVSNSVTIASSGYYTKPNVAYDAPALELCFFTASGLPTTSATTVSGTWGYHNNPALMWNETSITATLADTTTQSLTVSDASGFEILQYIKIGDEMLFITAIDGDTLTVLRGIHGTTASSHTDVAIQTFVGMPDVVDEAARLAMRRYQLRSGVEIVATGETAFELKLGDVQLSSRYRRYTVNGV